MTSRSRERPRSASLSCRTGRSSSGARPATSWPRQRRITPGSSWRPCHRLAEVPMAFAEPVELLPPSRMIRFSRLSALDRVGLIGVTAMTLAALAVPLIAPGSPTAQIGHPFLGPGHGGLLGTDDLGRDLFTRVLYGMRTSWFSALLVVAVSVVIGGAIGLLAGVKGGKTDAVLMRLTDLMLALPGPVLAIAV